MTADAGQSADQRFFIFLVSRNAARAYKKTATPENDGLNLSI